MQSKHNTTHNTCRLESIPLTKLEEAIRLAGSELKQTWDELRNSKEKKINVNIKPDGSKVSEADLRSNEILLNTLTELFPTHNILSEESEQPKVRSGELWIVDPLDGTHSFLDGNDDFSILVAHTLDGVVDLGMMFFPARGLFAIGKLGAGCSIDNTELKTSKNGALRAESTYLRHFNLNTPIKYPKWMDSGLALLSVANSKFDGAVIRLKHHKQWDLAAPSIIITEAGGKTSDEKGAVLDFSKIDFNYKYFVSSNNFCHEELLSLVQKDILTHAKV